LRLLERIKAVRGTDLEKRSSIDTWLNEYLMPSTFQYGGTTYPIGLKGTLSGNRAMEITGSLPSYTSAVMNCPPAFAAQDIRAGVLSQVRFTYRNLPWVVPTRKDPNNVPRRLFSKADLKLLENPWKGATTADLVTRMEWHAGLGGAAFVALRRDSDGPRLQVLRPDWCALLYGSQSQPDNPGHALDGVFLGTVYWNGGPNGPWGYGPEFLLPDECIHWIPKPDPLNAGSGMSWLSPAIRDIQSDALASDHKINYWKNGATPNLVIKGIPTVTPTQFRELVDMMEERHAGAANAFRTLYLTAGADASVIGNNFHEIDFRAVTAAGETRIALLSRVPASLLGIWDGLQGSSLNAGNFTAARRTFADTWVYPTLQDIAKSLAPLIKVPGDAELWFDVTDIPLLHEDAKDAAEITAVKASSIQTLWNAGFEADSVVAAVAPEWSSTLKHTGLDPVQAQPDHGLQKSNEVGQLLQPKNDN
jgi:phage portal protein BeeE